MWLHNDYENLTCDVTVDLLQFDFGIVVIVTANEEFLTRK